MAGFLPRSRTKFFYRFVASIVLFTFSFWSVFPPSVTAQVMPGLLNLPAPGTMVTATEAFAAPMIYGLSVDPVNPLKFEFYVHKGDKELSTPDLRQEAQKLIKYFLATLTTPEDELWVNLSPNEADRIISEKFGVTEMGRDMLAQDYLLKQLTASLTYPEKELGKKFWKRVYAQAKERFGTTDVPLDNFHKVWIVPARAKVLEKDGHVFVLEARLRVMMEEDYFALQNNRAPDPQNPRSPEGILTGEQGNRGTGELTKLQTQIMREIILPEIEREVNEGETFAPLRQIFHSMILATWYKKNLRETLLGKIYVDQHKIAGVDVEDKQIKEKIYQQYLAALKQGVFNYIKEDYDLRTQEVVPRQYFSGGMDNAELSLILEEAAWATPAEARRLRQLVVDEVRVPTVLLETDGSQEREEELAGVGEAAGPDSAMLAQETEIIPAVMSLLAQYRTQISDSRLMTPQDASGYTVLVQTIYEWLNSGFAQEERLSQALALEQQKGHDGFQQIAQYLLQKNQNDPFSIKARIKLGEELMQWFPLTETDAREKIQKRIDELKSLLVLENALLNTSPEAQANRMAAAQKYLAEGQFEAYKSENFQWVMKLWELTRYQQTPQAMSEADLAVQGNSMRILAMFLMADAVDVGRMTRYLRDHITEVQILEGLVRRAQPASGKAGQDAATVDRMAAAAGSLLDLLKEKKVIHREGSRGMISQRDLDALSSLDDLGAQRTTLDKARELAPKVARGQLAEGAIDDVSIIAAMLRHTVSHLFDAFPVKRETLAKEQTAMEVLTIILNAGLIDQDSFAAAEEELNGSLNARGQKNFIEVLKSRGTDEEGQYGPSEKMIADMKSGADALLEALARQNLIPAESGVEVGREVTVDAAMLGGMRPWLTRSIACLGFGVFSLLVSPALTQNGFAQPIEQPVSAIVESQEKDSPEKLVLDIRAFSPEEQAHFNLVLQIIRNFDPEALKILTELNQSGRLSIAVASEESMKQLVMVAKSMDPLAKQEAAIHIGGVTIYEWERAVNGKPSYRVFINERANAFEFLMFTLHELAGHVAQDELHAYGWTLPYEGKEIKAHSVEKAILERLVENRARIIEAAATAGMPFSDIYWLEESLHTARMDRRVSDIQVTLDRWSRVNDQSDGTGQAQLPERNQEILDLQDAYDFIDFHALTKIENQTLAAEIARELKRGLDMVERISTFFLRSGLSDKRLFVTFDEEKQEVAIEFPEGGSDRHVIPVSQLSDLWKYMIHDNIYFGGLPDQVKELFMEIDHAPRNEAIRGKIKRRIEALKSQNWKELRDGAPSESTELGIEASFVADRHFEQYRDEYLGLVPEKTLTEPMRMFMDALINSGTVTASVIPARSWKGPAIMIAVMGAGAVGFGLWRHSRNKEQNGSDENSDSAMLGELRTAMLDTSDEGQGKRIEAARKYLADERSKINKSGATELLTQLWGLMNYQYDSQGTAIYDLIVQRNSMLILVMFLKADAVDVESLGEFLRSDIGSIRGLEYRAGRTEPESGATGSRGTQEINMAGPASELLQLLKEKKVIHLEGSHGMIAQSDLRILYSLDLPGKDYEAVQKARAFATAATEGKLAQGAIDDTRTLGFLLRNTVGHLFNRGRLEAWELRREQTAMEVFKILVDAGLVNKEAFTRALAAIDVDLTPYYLGNFVEILRSRRSNEAGRDRGRADGTPVIVDMKSYADALYQSLVARELIAPVKGHGPDAAMLVQMPVLASAGTTIGILAGVLLGLVLAARQSEINRAERFKTDYPEVWGKFKTMTDKYNPSAHTLAVLFNKAVVIDLSGSNFVVKATKKKNGKFDLDVVAAEVKLDVPRDRKDSAMLVTLQEQQDRTFVPPGVDTKIFQGKTIGITGGSGYISAPLIKRYLDAGAARVVIMDNHIRNREEIAKLKGVVIADVDIADADEVYRLGRLYNIVHITHLAADIEAGVSMKRPAFYHWNNVRNTRRLLGAIKKLGIKSITFASSAGVYEGKPYPLDENVSVNPQNEYGANKRMMEKIMRDFSKKHGIRFAALRFFNAAGAFEWEIDGKTVIFGENHRNRETHIIPIIIEVLQGKRPFFTIFGGNYKTRDGSNVRDYIHVLDLANAIVRAAAWTMVEGQQEDLILNLGTGNGTSNLEMLAKIEEKTGKKFYRLEGEERDQLIAYAEAKKTEEMNRFLAGMKQKYHVDAIYIVGDPRPGDADSLTALADLAEKKLGWIAVHSDVDTIAGDAWMYHSQPEIASMPLPDNEVVDIEATEPVYLREILQDLAGDPELSKDVQFEELFRVFMGSLCDPKYEVNDREHQLPIYNAARDILAKQQPVLQSALETPGFVEMLKGQPLAATSRGGALAEVRAELLDMLQEAKESVDLQAFIESFGNDSAMLGQALAGVAFIAAFAVPMVLAVRNWELNHAQKLRAKYPDLWEAFAWQVRSYRLGELAKAEMFSQAVRVYEQKGSFEIVERRRDPSGAPVLDIVSKDEVLDQQGREDSVEADRAMLAAGTAPVSPEAEFISTDAARQLIATVSRDMDETQFRKIYDQLEQYPGGAAKAIYDIVTKKTSFGVFVGGDILETAFGGTKALILGMQHTQVKLDAKKQNPTDPDEKIVINWSTGVTPWLLYYLFLHVVQTWETPETAALLDAWGIDKSIKPDLLRILAFPLDAIFPQLPTDYHSFYHILNEFFKSAGIPEEQRRLFRGNLIYDADSRYKDDHYLREMTDEEYRALHDDINTRGGLAVDDFIQNKMKSSHPQYRFLQAMEIQAQVMSQELEKLGYAHIFISGLGPGYEGEGHVGFSEAFKRLFQRAYIQPNAYPVSAAHGIETGGIGAVVGKYGNVTFGYADLLKRPDVFVIVLGTGADKSSTITRGVETKVELTEDDQVEKPVDAFHTVGPDARGTFIADESAARELGLYARPEDYRIISAKEWASPKFRQAFFVRTMLASGRQLAELMEDDFLLLEGTENAAIYQVRQANLEGLRAQGRWDVLCQETIEHLQKALVLTPEELLAKFGWTVEEAKDKSITVIDPHIDDNFLGIAKGIGMLRSLGVHVRVLITAKGSTAVHDTYVNAVLKHIKTWDQEKIDEVLKQKPEDVIRELNKVLVKQNKRTDPNNFDIWNEMEPLEKELRAEALFLILKEHVNGMLKSETQVKDYVEFLQTSIRLKKQWGARDIGLAENVRVALRIIEGKCAGMWMGLDYDDIHDPFDSTWYGQEGSNGSARERDINDILEHFRQYHPDGVISVGEKNKDFKAHSSTQISVITAVLRLIQSGEIDPAVFKFLMYAGVWDRITTEDADVGIVYTAGETDLFARVFRQFFASQAPAPGPDAAKKKMEFFFDAVIANGTTTLEEFQRLLGDDIPGEIKEKMSSEGAIVLNYRMPDLTDKDVLQRLTDNVAELERVRDAFAESSSVSRLGPAPLPDIFSVYTPHELFDLLYQAGADVVTGVFSGYIDGEHGGVIFQMLDTKASSLDAKEREVAQAAKTALDAELGKRMKQKEEAEARRRENFRQIIMRETQRAKAVRGLRADEAMLAQTDLQRIVDFAVMQEGKTISVGNRMASFIRRSLKRYGFGQEYDDRSDFDDVQLKEAQRAARGDEFFIEYEIVPGGGSQKVIFTIRTNKGKLQLLLQDMEKAGGFNAEAAAEFVEQFAPAGSVQQGAVIDHAMLAEMGEFVWIAPIVIGASLMTALAVAPHAYLLTQAMRGSSERKEFPWLWDTFEKRLAQHPGSPVAGVHKIALFHQAVRLFHQGYNFILMEKPQALHPARFELCVLKGERIEKILSASDPALAQEVRNQMNKLKLSAAVYEQLISKAVAIVQKGLTFRIVLKKALEAEETGQLEVVAVNPLTGEEVPFDMDNAMLGVKDPSIAAQLEEKNFPKGMKARWVRELISNIRTLNAIEDLERMLDSNDPQYKIVEVRDAIRSRISSLRRSWRHGGSIERNPKAAPGGIDFNPALFDLEIKRDDNGVPLPIEMQSIPELNNIQGFVPVILEILPATNVPMLLGLTDEGEPKEGLSLRSSDGTAIVEREKMFDRKRDIAHRS